MTKKALLIGSSFSAAPIFFSLKNKGLHVSVCGNVKTDPCHQYADNSFYIDYSNPDALLQLVSNEHFDYLVPSCNDYSYLSGAWVAERTGFAGFDSVAVANSLHTKKAFRELTAQHNVPAPRSMKKLINSSNYELELDFPCLVKPIDSFSGRGVQKVHSTADLETAMSASVQSSRSGEVILEEFVEGTLHSHSAFIQDGRIVIDFFVDEFCTVYPYQVNCSNHPSMLEHNLREGVRLAIEKIIGVLSLCDGLLHTQFIVKGDQFWIIECMRRCPGDLYGTLIDTSLGINYTELFMRPFLKLSMLDEFPSYQSFDLSINSAKAKALQSPKPIARHTISTDKSATIFSFKASIPQSQLSVVPLKSSAERMSAAPYDKLAILFAEFQTEKAMFEWSPKLHECIELSTLEDKYLDSLY